jgi:hypothetical protein
MEISKEGKVVGYIPLSALMAEAGRTKGEYKPEDLLDPQEMLKALQYQTMQNNEWFRAPSEDVVAVAKEVILHHVKNRVVDHLRQYGFESQADIDNAELGEGFREFYIDTNKLQDESAPLDFQSLVFPNSTEWKFPIVANGETKMLVDVRFSDGIWRLGGMGGPAAWFGKEMTGLKATWPPSSGYRFRHIRLGRTTSFIEISKEGKIVGIIPMSTLMAKQGRAQGEFKSEDLRDPQEVLKELQVQINAERNSVSYKQMKQQKDNNALTEKK